MENSASLSGVISLALLLGSVLLVLGMLALLFGPLAAPARED
jgi:hypothetical protein